VTGIDEAGEGDDLYEIQRKAAILAQLSTDQPPEEGMGWRDDSSENF
jgi:hypothetical protein